MSQVHHDWLDKVTSDIAGDYARLHAAALEDPQKAWHGGEGTWLDLLDEWLPPAYEVAARKYIVPEEGDEMFEMDLVVFSPRHPRRLRNREEVLSGGVAAAFSVRLTLNADGIRDGVERAAALRRATKPRLGSARSELVGAFPVGLLAHSHAWVRPGSTPADNITRACWDLDHQLVRHPRESLDFLCVADLSTWTRARAPWIPPHAAAYNPTATVEQKESGFCMTAFFMTDRERSPAPVGVFIAHLLERLSYDDPLLKPLADGLRLTDTWGSGSGAQRLWNLSDVFSESLREDLPSRAFGRGGPDWLTMYH